MSDCVKLLRNNNLGMSLDIFLLGFPIIVHCFISHKIKMSSKPRKWAFYVNPENKTMSSKPKNKTYAYYFISPNIGPHAIILTTFMFEFFLFRPSTVKRFAICFCFYEFLSSFCS